MKKVVFFDIDGTLVNRQNSIPESAIRAVEQLKKQNILPVIATGRSPLLLEEIRQELGIDSYISMNGQYVVLEGNTIYANTIEKDTVRRFAETASSKSNGILLCGAKDIYANSLVSLAKRSSVWKVLKGLAKVIPGEIQLSLLRRALKKPPNPKEYAEEDIYQIILEETSEESSYQKEFTELNFTRSTPFSIDVISSGVSKAKGIEIFLDQMGIKPENTYGFGDSFNDLEMLEYVGVGVAMGNGRSEVKNAADLVTSSVTEDGIEKGLQQLGLIP